MSNKNLLYLLAGGALLYWLYRQSQSPAAQAQAALNTLAPVQVTATPLPNPYVNMLQTQGG